MNPKADQYFTKPQKWQHELQLFRSIISDCELNEELKWGQPCYTFNNNNIVMIQSFKTHCSLGFFNGALLKDSKGLLVKAGEHTQAGRQMRFSDVKEIEQLTPVIKSYIKEAVEIEKAGLKFKSEIPPDLIFVEELQEAFKNDLTLKKAFENLSPGRQRAYLIYFSSAKQSDTRQSRIKKCSAKIMCGKGLNDCTCGLSKRMPSCDGSHKYIK